MGIQSGQHRRKYLAFCAPVRDISIMSIPGGGPPSGADEATGPGGTPLDPDDLDDMSATCLLSIGTEGAEAMYMPYNCGRQSWRQIQ